MGLLDRFKKNQADESAANEAQVESEVDDASAQADPPVESPHVLREPGTASVPSRVKFSPVAWMPMPCKIPNDFLDRLARSKRVVR